MQRGSGHDGGRNQKYRGSTAQGGYEDKRGSTGGYEDRRIEGAAVRHSNSRGEGNDRIYLLIDVNTTDRGGGPGPGFEVRRNAGFEDRRGSRGHRPENNHQV